MAIGTYYHVTPTGAGAKNGLTWATAFDEPALEAFLEATVVAGDVIFIESGTYTLDSSIDWSARDGTGIAPIALIGVTTAPRLGGREGAAILYSDWATEANRPFFDCVTFQILASDYNVIRNIYFQGSINNTVISGGYSVIENCKFDNDNGGSAARFSINIVSGVVLFCNNEVLSANCGGVNSVGSYNTIINNYFHDIPDAANGIAISVVTGGSNLISHNIFDNCLVGIKLTVGFGNKCINNTFYDVDTGVTASTAKGFVGINNIMEGSATDGFIWTTQTDINFFWKNHGNDARCTDMWDGVDTATIYQDYAVSTGDPLFATAGSNHSIGVLSPCYCNGMGMASNGLMGVGSVNVAPNRGAYQGMPIMKRTKMLGV